MAVFTSIATGLSAVTGLAISGAAVAGTVAVAGVAAGVQEQKRATSIARQSAAVQRQAAETQITMQKQAATRQRRSAIRASLIARSQARQRALAAGVADSSMVAGGLSSLSSQLGANLGFGSMMSGLGQQYTGLSAQAAQLSGEAQLGFAQAGTFFDLAKFSTTQYGRLK